MTRGPTAPIHSARDKRTGQASLEMTVALIGVMLLVLGSVKVCMWLTTRLVKRQQAYEATRVDAGKFGSNGYTEWTEPNAPLDIFTGD